MAATVGVRGVSLLLGVQLGSREWMLSTRLGPEGDTPRIRRGVPEQDMGSPTKTSANYTRNAVVV